MKIAYILIFLFGVSTLPCFGLNKDYSGVPEQKTIEESLKILSIYYPADELCVSDSIYDLDWFFFSDEVDCKSEKVVEYHRINKNAIWDEPMFSKELAVLAANFNSEHKNYKYVALFSEPYYNMIRCDVLPYDRKIGFMGSPIIYSFLFKYNEEGEITLFIKAEVNVD